MLFRRAPKKTNSHENLISLSLTSSKSLTAAAAAAAEQDKDNDVIDNNLINNNDYNDNDNHQRHSSNSCCCSSSNYSNNLGLYRYISRSKSKSNKMPTFLSTITSYMNSTRLMVLIVLCLQNSLFTVLRRYSQGVLKEDYSKVRFMLCHVTIYIYIYIYIYISRIVSSLYSLTYLLTHSQSHFTFYISLPITIIPA
jgi:hypothetical protein